MTESNTRYGVHLGPGDGSVPLISLGHMCAGPWRESNSYLNPGHVRTIIREYVHKTTPLNILTTHIEDLLRGGEHAITHMELLGNRDFIMDLIMIVTEPIPGTNQSVFAVNVNDDRIYSNIAGISARIMKRQSSRS